MRLVNPPNHQEPQLIVSLCWNLQQHRIIPKALSVNKIDAMLCAIGFAFCSIKFKIIYGIKIIPLLHFFANWSIELFVMKVGNHHDTRTRLTR